VFHESNFILFIPGADRFPKGRWGILWLRAVTGIEEFKRLHHAYFSETGYAYFSETVCLEWWMMFAVTHTACTSGEE
jgi:hypothetical protein